MKTKSKRVRPNRNEIARRVAIREGGKKQDGIGQVKDVIARYWDELVSLDCFAMYGVIADEIRSAEERSRRGSPTK